MIKQLFRLIPLAPLFGILVACSTASDCRGQAAVFVGSGYFDSKQMGAKAPEALAGTGFETALLEVHFTDKGFVRSNRNVLVKGGKWVASEEKKQNLINLIEKVERVELWFAGWGRRDYDKLRKVKANPEATAELEKNLAVVKSLGVTGITDDDEDVYDTELAIWMGKKIKESGLLLSIAPYKRPEHWARIVSELGVDRIYYQSYSPRRRLEGWDQLEGELWPGVNTEKDNARMVDRKFDQWSRNPKVVGGFVWSYDIIRKKYGGDFKGFASAINQQVAKNSGAARGEVEASE